MGSACDHIEHTKTQLFYAITVASISILFGYIPVGLGMPIYVVLPIALLVIVGVVHFFGKSVKDIAMEKTTK
jgi:Na+/H+ antiporter NhaC